MLHWGALWPSLGPLRNPKGNLHAGFKMRYQQPGLVCKRPQALVSQEANVQYTGKGKEPTHAEVRELGPPWASCACRNALPCLRLALA